jgi:hypothetical protein
MKPTTSSLSNRIGLSCKLGLLIVLAAMATAPAEAGTLFAINDSTDQLVTINRTNGAVTTIGALGVSGDFGDLTWNSANNTLYAVGGRGNDALYTINQTTGAATLVGSHGIGDMFSLAHNSTDGKLYAQSTNQNVYTLDLSTGAATAIGSNGVYPGGYAYNSGNSTLYSLEAGGGGIYSINTSNGAATFVASGGGINDNGFTYDSEFNVFWAADWSNNFFSYDATTFARTTVANLGDSYAAIAFAGTSNVPDSGSSLALIGIGLASLVAIRRRKSA